MGRDYIGERTIANPRERAAEKKRRVQAERKRRAADQRALAAYLERTRHCRRRGCGNPAEADGGWWPCCCEGCFRDWESELARRDEVKAAHRAGVPVAQYRRQR